MKIKVYKKIFVISAILSFAPILGFSDDFDLKDSHPEILKGNVYEIKSMGSVPIGQGIYIDMVIDPSQEEIILKRFKFKEGADWGVVSNDSKDTIHLDSIKKDGDSKVIIVGSEAQDTDGIKVKIELSAFDQSRAQFTEALVDIICDVDHGSGDLTLSLKKLHLRAIKVK